MAIETEVVVNIHDAKTHFSKLLQRVAAGECIVIAKAGKPVAVLGPYSTQPADLPFGMDKGKVVIHDNWDEPLPEFDEYM